MLHFVYLFSIFFVSTAVLADTVISNPFEVIEELNNIHNQYRIQMKNYMDSSRQDINALLNIYGVRKKFMERMEQYEQSWNRDMNRRETVVLEKLVSNNFVLKNITVEDLKRELKTGLQASTEFWKARVDRKLHSVRINPEIFDNYSEEPKVIRTTAELVLPPALQRIYNNQMGNLTNIATLTKLLFEIRLKQFRADNLYNTTSLSYISDKTLVDMLKKDMRENLYTNMDEDVSNEIETIKTFWKTDNIRGPTEKQFNKSYKDLCDKAVNLLQKINDNLKPTHIQYGICLNYTKENVKYVICSGFNVI